MCQWAYLVGPPLCGKGVSPAEFARGASDGYALRDVVFDGGACAIGAMCGVNRLRKEEKRRKQMIVGFIIEALVGGLLIVLGLILWIKRAVSILHSYHYKNVKEEDLPAYCRFVGIGLTVMGAGMIVTGIFNLLYLALWWVPMVVGFVIGFALFLYAQKKYNGSVMG